MTLKQYAKDDKAKKKSKKIEQEIINRYMDSKRFNTYDRMMRQNKGIKLGG